MKREVLQKGSDILRIKCEPVKNFANAQEVIVDLNDTLKFLKTTYPFPRGIGLAAPQIGVNSRISVAEYDGKQYVLINPVISEKSEKVTPIKEGCISFFKYRAMVPRHEYVKVKAFDQNAREYTVEGHGDFAMLLQHELDHLDGVLYVDYLKNKEKICS